MKDIDKNILIQALDQLPVGTLLVDARQDHWPVVYMNSIIGQLTGLDTATLIGCPWRGLLVDPDAQEHTLTAEELRAGRAFISKWFPILKDQPLVESKVCQREDSVDEHFIVCPHPELSNVWIVGGGSGHGYKHGIILGDYVAHRVVGQDKHPELATTFTLKDRSF